MSSTSEIKPKKSDRLNVMRNVQIEKLIVHICVGDSSDKITRAAKVLQALTGQESVTSKARFTINAFGIRRNAKIAVYCTVRGEKAKEILSLGLRVKDYELQASNFSSTGTFGFGIKEHIARPGGRVTKRKHARARHIGKNHKVSKDQAINWFEKEFDGTIL